MITVYRNNNVEMISDHAEFCKKYLVDSRSPGLFTITGVRFSHEDIWQVLTHSSKGFMFIFNDCDFEHCVFTSPAPTNCWFINCTFTNVIRLTIDFYYINIKFYRCSFADTDLPSSGNRYTKFDSCIFDNVRFIKDEHCIPYYNTFSNCDYFNCSGPVPFNSACPTEGSFIGFKKIANIGIDGHDYCIAKLLIPEDAERLSAGSSKCRASKAVVLNILNTDGTPVKDSVLANTKFFSLYDSAFEYRKGETIVPDNFDTNPWKECSNGIHFFMSFEEAANYSLY